MSNLFDRSSQQEFTWQSKHIKFFLDLKGFGPATVEKIIDINPDIDQWDREYVAGQSSNYEKFIKSLPEEIPHLADLDDEMVINFKNPRFPKRFLDMKKDKPLLIWYKGSLDLDDCIAVVGSRNVVPETKKITEEIVSLAGERNLSIVSGLAKGVDEAAHISALENNLKTIAILPSSLDNILPTSNKNLAFEIIENGGLLLSEYEIGSPRNPEKSNYIRRNRLQAGLSEATIIAQSSIDGGTMTTAKHTIDNERYLVVYNSHTDVVEYSGNFLLCQPLKEVKNIDSILSKQQQKLVQNKEKIADFEFDNNNSFKDILGNIFDA